MRRALLILAGAGAPLVLSDPAPAGFVGVKIVETVVDTLWVCDVYAVFDRTDDEIRDVSIVRRAAPTVAGAQISWTAPVPHSSVCAG